MKNRKEIFKLILFISILLEKALPYIIYPFKTRKSQIENTQNNLTLLFRSLIDNNIYINMEMGEPKQTIDVFLRTDSEILYFSEKNKTDLNYNYTNPIINDVNSDINNFFDKDKSSTFNMTDKSASVYNDYGKYSNDIFNFKTNKNNIKLRTSFALLKHTRGNMPGVLGFRLLTYDSYRPYNLIEQLKANDVIDSYFWMINYTSNDEGNLILGEQPHVFDPLHYKEENLRNAYTFLYTTIKQWGLRFNEITFNENINFRPYHECIFKYELNYILGIDRFQKELDIYFNESIFNGTCFKEKIKYPYDPHIFYYCDKEKYKDNIKYFPSLKFEHIELNYTFELNYKDLFIEKDDKYILLVFFGDYGVDWYLGKPFLRKYSFLMNPDSKLVGFYTKINDENEDTNNDSNDKSNNKKADNKNNNVLLKAVFVIIGIIILLILGILLGKFLLSNKNKRLNVIDDEYDYNAKDDEINNQNAEEIN